MIKKTYKHKKLKRGNLRKIIISFTLLVFLTDCAETLALLGPASTAAGSGNLARSSLTTAVNIGMKKTTGKTSLEHALAFAERHNPERKKVKCVSFLEVTESEVCSILQKRVSELKRKIDEKSKIKILD